MKILSILGSPRKNGNTATILGWVEDELKSAGHEVGRVDIIDYDINGCLECYTCKKIPDAPGCAQTDDGNDLMERLLESDAVILASPLFAWGFTAQMKTFVDRTFCLVAFDEKGPLSLVDGKPFGLLVTAGGPVEKNMDLIVKEFERITKWNGSVNAGTLLVPHCTNPDEIAPEIREQAREFAQKMITSN